jgi:hypothetical protein
MGTRRCAQQGAADEERGPQHKLSVVADSTGRPTVVGGNCVSLIMLRGFSTSRSRVDLGQDKLVT